MRISSHFVNIYLDKTDSQSLHEIKSLLLSSRPHPLSFLTLPYLLFTLTLTLTPGQAPKKPKRATNKTPHLLTPPPTLAPRSQFPSPSWIPLSFRSSGRLRQGQIQVVTSQKRSITSRFLPFVIRSCPFSTSPDFPSIHTRSLPDCLAC